MAAEIDLAGAFVAAHPEEAAAALERLPADQAAGLLEALPAGTAGRALALATPALAAGWIARLDATAAAAALAGVPADRTAVLLRQVEAARRPAILGELPRDQARLLDATLRYPDGTAGALMDPAVAAVADDVTVGRALMLLRRSPHRPDGLVYVVDRAHALQGVVRLGALVAARRADPVASVMTRAVPWIPARAGRAAIAAHPGWRQFPELPVIDESTLVGAIPYDTYRTIDAQVGGRHERPNAATTVFALGELYWLGLSGIVDGIASVVRRAAAGGGPAEGGRHV